jgi:hypothetical protein
MASDDLTITLSRVGSFRAGRHGDHYAQTSHLLDCSGGRATLIARGKLIAGAAAALAAPSLILRPIVDADDGEDRLGAVRRRTIRSNVSLLTAASAVWRSSLLVCRRVPTPNGG